MASGFLLKQPLCRLCTELQTVETGAGEVGVGLLEEVGHAHLVVGIVVLSKKGVFLEELVELTLGDFVHHVFGFAFLADGLASHFQLVVDGGLRDGLGVEGENLFAGVGVGGHGEVSELLGAGQFAESDFPIACLSLDKFCHHIPEKVAFTPSIFLKKPSGIA